MRNAAGAGDGPVWEQGRTPPHPFGSVTNSNIHFDLVTRAAFAPWL
jgi:hypothetical protein